MKVLRVEGIGVSGLRLRGLGFRGEGFRVQGLFFSVVGCRKAERCTGRLFLRLTV